ncbi:MAG: hypothetical protein ACOZCL_08620 [Bacillota bacterium]
MPEYEELLNELIEFKAKAEELKSAKRYSDREKYQKLMVALNHIDLAIEKLE